MPRGLKVRSARRHDRQRHLCHAKRSRIATARVEASIESYMEMVLHDWELYQSGKGNDRRYATCCSQVALHSEHSECQTHASSANHSCIAWQNGQ